MKTHQWQYLKWFSAEEMHEVAKNWVSELHFVRDEQDFFEQLLQQLTVLGNSLPTSLTINNLKEELAMLQRDCTLLVSAVLTHQNKGYILLDGINQLEEEERYKEAHRELLDAIGEFLIQHTQIKKEVFKVSKVLLKQKEKRIKFISS